MDDAKEFTLQDKIDFFNGDGSWKTKSPGGKIDSIFMSDGPHGIRKQIEKHYSDVHSSLKAVCFPTLSCAASSWNKEALKKMGQAIAREAVEKNVDVVLGPGVNIKRSPLCGRNFEYFSEDPYLAGTLAAYYINGMQEKNVSACIKHFACNNQEYYRQASDSVVGKRALHEIYLRPFEIAIKESKPDFVMCSYNKINNVYASENSYLLKDVLRNKFGFTGAVISDWGAVLNSSKSVKAGVNLAMPDSKGFLTNQLKKAVKNGEVTEKDLDSSVSSLMLAVQKKSKKLNADFSNQKEPSVVSYEIASESAVLLKNSGMLPLKKKKVALIGQLAENVRIQGGGSSHVNCGKVKDIITEFVEAGYEVEYEEGYILNSLDCKKSYEKNKNYLYWAQQFAMEMEKENVPVIVFTGLSDYEEGEGFDRENISLPAEQLALVNRVCSVCSNVCVVNFSGSPVAFKFADRVNALLQMYLAGQNASRTCVDILTGKVNPSGHLAETFPFKDEFVLKNRNVFYDEGIYCGYKYYQKNKIPVLFEFGFGLSYTTFKYGNLSVNKNQDGTVNNVEFELTNTGSVSGGEVCQVYIERNVKVLCGFEKVFLNPGETKKINIALSENAFSVYSTVYDSWKVLGGSFKLTVGSSLSDERLETCGTVKGFLESELFDEKKDSAEYEEHKNKALESIHKKGSFTLYDSLGDMAKESFLIKIILSFLIFVVRLMNKSKSIHDPSVKIAVCALKENPLASLISTSGGAVSEGFAKRLVKIANR